MDETEYDKVPYKSNPYAVTHPDHLAVMARVMGMTSPPPPTARVLELGCGAGGNLLPMAAMMPNAKFVGVDLSPTSIAHATDVARDLGLTNIDLRAMSIADVDASFGTFDYILCHGVYSWVPEFVRTAILRIASESLNPTGVAYISYNCLPGWALRGVVRDIMMYHTRDWTEPAEKTAQARAILDFLVKSTSDESDWGKVLRVEHERMSGLSDWYIYHDNLSADNKAFWFHEFSASADAAGLEYLGDSIFTTMLLDNFPANVKDVLAGLGGELVRTEQYLDYVRCRMFRQSLLVKKGAPVDRRIDASRVRQFQFTTRARPVNAEPDFTPGVTETFQTAEALEITSESPLVKAALLELYRSRPEAIAFDDLLDRARLRLGESDPSTRDHAALTLSSNLLSCFSSGVVVPHLWTRPYASRVPEKPKSWAFARLQASKGLHTVTNYRHEGARLDTFERHVLIASDGERDREAIVDYVIAAIDRGEIRVRKEDETPFTDPVELRQELNTAVDGAVLNLCRLCLLEG